VASAVHDAPGGVGDASLHLLGPGFESRMCTTCSSAGCRRFRWRASAMSLARWWVELYNRCSRSKRARACIKPQSIGAACNWFVLRLPAVFCALAVLVCELIASRIRPWVCCDDMSYNPDRAQGAETGHIFYNGPTTPFLGWQLYLGALFIKLFGYSLTTVRMSTLFGVDERWHLCCSGCCSGEDQ